MVELWRELDGVAFETEALDFLPHAPVLLTMAAAKAASPSCGARARSGATTRTRREAFGQGGGAATS